MRPKIAASHQHAAVPPHQLQKGEGFLFARPLACSVFILCFYTQPHNLFEDTQGEKSFDTALRTELTVAKAG